MENNSRRRDSASRGSDSFLWWNSPFVRIKAQPCQGTQVPMASKEDSLSKVFNHAFFSHIKDYTLFILEMNVHRHVLVYLNGTWSLDFKKGVDSEKEVMGISHQILTPIKYYITTTSTYYSIPNVFSIPIFPSDPPLLPLSILTPLLFPTSLPLLHFLFSSPISLFSIPLFSYSLSSRLLISNLSLLFTDQFSIVTFPKSDLSKLLYETSITRFCCQKRY